MNRMELRQLAEDRMSDAANLLAGQRWSGAYYLSGYAVECGLKACIMAHVEKTGAIFVDKKFGEKCWTHDLRALRELANLDSAYVASIVANPLLLSNWSITNAWEETSRYKQKNQAEAESLYNAIADTQNGVLTWIRLHW